ncbi:MAG: ABC transporter transmembrane domain-containing protein [Ruthenibacterium lactatiformans]
MLLPVTVSCILFNAVVSSMPSIFMQNVIAAVEQSWQSGDLGCRIRADSASGGVAGGVLCLQPGRHRLHPAHGRHHAGLAGQNARTMFNGMQDLPIRYFDTHNHGDMMSYYTNDIDTLRQMISQSFPQLLISAVTVITVFSIMLYYSIWLAAVVVLGVVCMVLVVRRIGGGSAKYFVRQQQALGRTEGY